jgi:hypothetical protein
MSKIDEAPAAKTTPPPKFWEQIAEEVHAALDPIMQAHSELEGFAVATIYPAMLRDVPSGMFIVRDMTIPTLRLVRDKAQGLLTLATQGHDNLCDKALAGLVDKQNEQARNQEAPPPK